MRKHLIILDGGIVGLTSNPNATVGQAIPIPSDFRTDKLHWYRVDGEEILLDVSIALDEARAARVVGIKSEAFEKITALDWKLDRAREREDASWESLEAVNAVLAMRESIRRSSDEAEAAVMSLTDITEIESFAWAVTINVPAPRRVTRQQFLDRLTAEETAGIIEAAQSSSAIAAWILRLENADFVNLDDAACLMAMESLEIAGLIAAGRAQEIIS